MTPVGFDHVKLQIPADGLSDARRFYEEVLTLPLEGVDRYRSGEKPFVSARISPSSVIHIEPTAEFEMPQQTHYDHLAVRFEESIETIQPVSPQRYTLPTHSVIGLRSKQLPTRALPSHFKFTSRYDSCLCGPTTSKHNDYLLQ